jgi:hypothetical protein
LRVYDDKGLAKGRGQTREAFEGRHDRLGIVEFVAEE